MLIEVEIWQLISLLIGFFGAIAGFAKVLLSQFEKRLEERFDAQEHAKADAQKHWDEKFSSIEQAMREEAAQWSRVERDLLELRAELPVRYVMREDYIRGQSILEAKLDGLALKIENIQLKGKN